MVVFVKIWLSLVLFFSLPLLGRELSLKNFLSDAKPGQYVVAEQGKTYAFLFICERSQSHLTIEEVAIPVSHFTRQRISWKNWFEAGAPGHTLWTLAKIHIPSGAFEEVYSYTKQSSCSLSESNAFLTTLLNLPFEEISKEERKKVGFAPGYGKPDHRPLWNPRVIVEGSALANVPFDAYSARWPHDRSELAGKVLVVYFPQKIEREKFPTFFPYLVEIEGKVGSAKLRIVDSGTDAHSPMQPHLVNNSTHLVH